MEIGERLCAKPLAYIAHVVANIELTLLDKRFQSIEKIDSSCVTDRLELLVVRDVNMRAQIMGRKAQTDNQASVAEDLLIVAKNRIGKLGVER